jgi:predicted negative regulator of RcsB-dependent stress response
MKNFINITDTEDEQVEQIKNWWKSNGKQIIAGAVIGLAGIWGWNSYSTYQDQQTLEARALYLNYASDSSNLGAYDKLTEDFANNSYTDQAALLMAKHLFDEGNYTEALNLIEPLTKHSNSMIASSAILRLASIYLQTGQHDKALTLLEPYSDESFAGLVHNLIGDIYLDIGNKSEAQRHFNKAIDAVTENSNLSQLIQIKLDDLN